VDFILRLFERRSFFFFFQIVCRTPAVTIDSKHWQSKSFGFIGQQRSNSSSFFVSCFGRGGRLWKDGGQRSPGETQREAWGLVFYIRLYRKVVPFFCFYLINPLSCGVHHHVGRDFTVLRFLNIHANPYRIMSVEIENTALVALAKRILRAQAGPTISALLCPAREGTLQAGDYDHTVSCRGGR
jgi:hypothetical protein